MESSSVYERLLETCTGESGVSTTMSAGPGPAVVGTVPGTGALADGLFSLDPPPVLVAAALVSDMVILVEL